VNGGLRRLILTAFFLFAASVAADPLRVGKVKIETLDVYSGKELERGAFYRLADRFHVETRDSVIEHFLLFKEGDPYHPERLEETERNLRALPFLKSAAVVASEPRDGVVDVTVTTQDAWSIAPETQGGSKGGSTTFGATISDTNLLGLGKELQLGWERDIDRNRVVFNYNDRVFFAPYWRSHTEIAMTSDGYERRFDIVRPFYAFSTPWATRVAYAAFRRDHRLYDGGREVEKFQYTRREVTGFYGIAYDASDLHARRISAGMRFLDDSFDRIEGETTQLPSERSFRYVYTRLESAQNDFIKVNFVNKDLRYEDFNLGAQFAVEAAISPRFLDAPSTTGLVSLSAADGIRLGKNAFVMSSLTASSRLAGGAQNAMASATATLVHRRGGNHPTAFVARTVFNRGWRLDREVQFFADGLTGLRGYRTYAFAGSRSVVVNLEQRFYLGRELLQLASPGLVAFIDAGDAWDRKFGLKVDAGIGIRVGLPRTPKNLLRVDLAYALQKDPLGRKGWLISFSSGQAF
jgi:hypothetical protein